MVTVLAGTAAVRIMLSKQLAVADGKGTVVGTTDTLREMQHYKQ